MLEAKMVSSVMFSERRPAVTRQPTSNDDQLFVTDHCSKRDVGPYPEL